MSVFAHTSKREIVRLDFAKTGADISASSVDNSFNSVTSDLSGLKVGEWFKATGEGVNNGWHQVAQDSTTNKIKTNSALTDEAIGPSVALKGFMHGYGQQYSVEIYCEILDDDINPVTESGKARGGNGQSNLARIEKRWQVTTDEIQHADKPYWEEFIASTATLEPVVFDPYGTIASPDDPQIYTRVGSASIDRVENEMSYTVSLTLERVLK